MSQTQTPRWSVALMIVVVAMLLTTTPTPQSARSASPPLIVVYSIVQGFDGPWPGPDGACIALSRFQRKAKIVWRIKVIDPATGHPLDDKAMRSVKVNLPNKPKPQTLTAKYGPHPWKGPKPTDHFWSAAWTVPVNYPKGTLRFTITAIAKDGRTGTPVDFDVSASQPVVF